MGMLEWYRNPGGSSRPGRNTSKWGKKVFPSVCFVRLTSLKNKFELRWQLQVFVLCMSYVVCEKSCIPSEFVCVTISLPFRGPDPPPLSAFMDLQPQTSCWTRRRGGETASTGTSSGITSEWRSTQNSSSSWARERRSILQTQWPSTTGGSRYTLATRPLLPTPHKSPSWSLSCKTNSSFGFSYYQNRTWLL